MLQLMLLGEVAGSSNGDSITCNSEDEAAKFIILLLIYTLFLPFILDFPLSLFVYLLF